MNTEGCQLGCYMVPGSHPVMCETVLTAVASPLYTYSFDVITTLHVVSAFI